MSTQQKSSSRTAEEVAQIQDPGLRARAALELMADADVRRSMGQDIRNAAVRQLRDAGFTVPEIAAQTMVNPHTVRSILY